MVDDSEFLLGPVPASSLMPLCEAADIVAEYGRLVAELNNPNRWDPGIAKTVAFSLPVDRLGYSKEKVQIALAVFIANEVARLAMRPNCERRRMLENSIAILGDLVWFTRRPVKGDGELWSKFWAIASRASDLYTQWQQLCERTIEREMDDQAVPKRAGNLPCPECLTKYWETIDRLAQELLKHPILAVIRKT